MKLTPIAALMALALCGTAQASHDETAGMLQRNVNQQNRIEQGLRSGELSTQEAGRLELREARLERQQAQQLRDGRGLSMREQDRLQDELHDAGRAIRRNKHDGDRANPNSPSARRLAVAVQRNARQQERIARGLSSGELTDREAARLLEHQARISELQARAAADGFVTAGEENRIASVQRRLSHQLYARKHNERDRDRRDY